MCMEPLTRKFEQIGARVRVRAVGALPWRQRSAAFVIDVTPTRKGEVFDISVVRPDVEFHVADVRPHGRHLLLKARTPADRPHQTRVWQSFLCGYDERHWFVASVPGVSSV